MTKVGILPGSLILTLFPSFSTFQGREDHDRTRALFAYAIKYLIIGIGPVSVILAVLAGPILGVWLGEEFARTSTFVFQVLAIGFLTGSLSDVPLALVQGIGRPDLPAKMNLVEFFVFVPLSWVFIKTWGIGGAAAAWTLRVTVEMIVLLAMASRVGGMRFSRRELFQTGIPQGVAALALFALGAVLVQSLWGRLYGLLLPAAGFLAACGVFVLSRKEIAWLREGLPCLLQGAGGRRAGV